MHQKDYKGGECIALSNERSNGYSRFSCDSKIDLHFMNRKEI